MNRWSIFAWPYIPGAGKNIGFMDSIPLKNGKRAPGEKISGPLSGYAHQVRKSIDDPDNFDDSSSSSSGFNFTVEEIRRWAIASYHGLAQSNPRNFYGIMENLTNCRFTEQSGCSI